MHGCAFTSEDSHIYIFEFLATIGCAIPARINAKIVLSGAQDWDLKNQSVEEILRAILLRVAHDMAMLIKQDQREHARGEATLSSLRPVGAKSITHLAYSYGHAVLIMRKIKLIEG